MLLLASVTQNFTWKLLAKFFNALLSTFEEIETFFGDCVKMSEI